ncbi:putative tRNA pseudouridine synthase D [Frankliniella fusca]|uniref:tRNA pseudouridine synthase D n=1 Tax=Frankliniella fusca TaxID=407009 RepID=A0AAE1LLU0_9NEOP|nr:putative tRNA pseudouridine synthase D [Frankliniella fusca]
MLSILKKRRGTVLRSQGLAIQTSATSGKPHEIDVEIDLKLEEGNRITSLKCSCIAGLSSKCKHAVATVLWLTRHAEEDLSDVSCTDLEQQWGKLKTSGKPLLEGCRLTELCHFKQIKRAEVQVPEETRKKWADILTKCKFYN